MSSGGAGDVAGEPPAPRHGLRPCTVVVVDADGVVAEAHEAVDEAVRHFVVGIVGGEAEVDAVEALLHAGKLLELEMAADGLEPAVLSGGGVLKPLAGEVEGGAGDDVLAVVEAHPVVVGGYVERL